MDHKQQNLSLLRQHIAFKAGLPYFAAPHADYWPRARCEEAARRALHELGGIAGDWRTDRSECTYYAPQRVNGALVDLSTVERVREAIEGIRAPA